ncbi:MAG: UDP-N-acetyl glucosamine 2-epimerase [Proteobacteria bacterium]|nr:UDP-N-acetyl glucosamine 2-epimerase [Pseudomonadota bacterium]
MKNKNLLFVSYGGAHVFILHPVIKKAIDLGFNVSVVSFTTGIDLYKKMGVDCFSAKDFFYKDDLEIKKYGTMLLNKMTEQGSKVIDEEETIAYLGFSFNDLVKSSGSFENAMEEYNANGRGIFLPITLMERVFAKFSPDAVITTNSPRAEKAAQMLANKNGILSLQIPDLFCNFERYKLIADYICVINETAKDNLIKIYDIDPKNIIITGNPDFDKFIHMKKELSTVHLNDIKTKYKLNEGSYLLWNDQRTLVTGESQTQIENSEKDVEKNLEGLKRVCDNIGYNLLVKCHSSQNKDFFRKWCSLNQVKFIEDHELYDLMKVSDVVIGYASTILVNAYNLGKPVIILNKTKEASFLPITDRKGVKEIDDLEQLEDSIAGLKNIKLLDDAFGDGNAVSKIVNIIKQYIK